MTQRKAPYKLRRSPVSRFWKPIVLFMLFLLLASFGVIKYHNFGYKPKQASSDTSSTQSSGGLTVSTQSSGSISLAGEPPQVRQILKLINDARTTNGVSPVSENSLLDKSAKLKLKDMTTRNYWSHNAPDGTRWMSFIQQAGYVYSAAAENLSYGQYRYYPEQTIVDGWLNSPEHRQNMLNGRYTEIGIAIKKASSFNGQQDVWIIVTHYGTPVKQSGSSSQRNGQSSSSYNPNLAQYLPSSYSSKPLPDVSNGGSSATLQLPPPKCVKTTDSSYSC